ncbi:MAG: FHIPEP family type III secretion protein [Thermoguttaceae bacterium]|nr:FHIPEP family type III secretion protein [Thermoguttaceae bacterium]
MSTPTLMSSESLPSSSWGRYLRAALLPISIILAVAVLLAPLPAWTMDFLLSINLAFAVLMLSTVLFIRTPLEFSVFPTILLAATLFRLVLNIATTRLILTNAPADGALAAGQVINAFSNFVTGSNLVVGVVIFLILVLIQFLVITKGASRISEVAARFALDSLPGKQAAIDADLNSGLITQQDAQNRRVELGRQSDFFGAMDGASKFVRGDAIAGLCITAVNIVGGLVIGLSQGMNVTNALDVFTRLTIGDGLVSQLPALLISLAAAMLMTRSAEKTELPEEVSHQVFSHSGALLATGVFLFLLTLTQLPKIPLMLLGTGFVGLAWILNERNKEQQRRSEEILVQKTESEKASAVDNLLTVDPIEIQLGRGLTGVFTQETLLDAIRETRRYFAREWGVLLPKVSVTDSSAELEPNEYRINLHGVPVCKKMIYPDMAFAVDLGDAYGTVAGLLDQEPETKNPGYWINRSQIEEAKNQGYVIREPSELIFNHLKELCVLHADELLTRDSAKALIDQLRKTSPAVVDELIPSVMTLSAVEQVLQRLLKQRVPIRQLELILDVLGSAPSGNLIEQVERVRVKLGRTICTSCADSDNEILAIMLSPDLQTTIRDNCRIVDNDVEIGISPSLRAQLDQKLAIEIEQLRTMRRPPVLITSSEIRALVQALFQDRFPYLTILGAEEIPMNMNPRSSGVIMI